MMYLGNQAVGMATSLPVFADIAKIECHNLIFTEDTLVNNYIINHSLGAIPDFITCYSAEPFESNSNTKYLVQTCMSLWPVSDNDAYAISLYYKPMGLDGGGAIKSTISTMSSVQLWSKSVVYFKANVQYFYIVGTVKEVTSNAS